jgi:hypothetical protein
METIPLPNAQPDTISSSPAIFKTVGAVIAALVTWFFVATVLNLALRAWWPHYHEAETAFNFTLAMKLARLVLGAISLSARDLLPRGLARFGCERPCSPELYCLLCSSLVTTAFGINSRFGIT